MYQFDKIIDRRGTNSYKWDVNQEQFGRQDVLPMWVADMDFRCPQALLEVLQARLDHGILGYTSRDDGYLQAIKGWLSRRFGWQVPDDWITFCPPGVMPAVCILIDLLSQPNDKVILQTPNYTSLMDAVKDKQRLLVENPLCFDGNRYSIDFDDLLAKIDWRTKILLLCSPNNPTGTVWRYDELRRLGKICADHGIFVISDEVHSDLVYPGAKHTPFGALPQEISEMSATCLSPNKTFNVGGLLTSTVIIPNQILKERYEAELGTWQIRLDNVFGRLAVETLYSDPRCEAWLSALLGYLLGNIEHAVRRINATGVLRTRRPDATYLLWIDFSGWGMTDVRLRDFLINTAQLGLSDGLEFGRQYGQFMRLNVACPRALLDQALDRLDSATYWIRREG